MPDRGFIAELRKRKVFQVAAIYSAVAWGVTEIAVTVVEQLFLPPWVSTLAVIGFVVGFPIAIFLAWTFDITSEGIQRTTVSSRRGKASIIASLLLLIASTAGLFFLIKPSIQDRTSPIRITAVLPNSIAVLPFENTSQDPDDTYLSEGLSDELRDQLGRVSGLRIAARSSSIAVQSLEAEAMAMLESGHERRVPFLRWNPLDLLLTREHRNCIAVRLAHLSTVGAGHSGNAVENVRLGECENFGLVGSVETLRDVARHLDVLLLIAAYGYQVGAVEQDVRGHQDRIREESVIGGLPLRELVLVGVAALEQPHRRHRREIPGELANLGNVALTKQHSLSGIEAAGQKIERDFAAVAPPLLGIANAVHRVEIGDEDQRLVFLLQRDLLAQRTEVVTNVQMIVGWLGARENPHRYAPST